MRVPLAGLLGLIVSLSTGAAAFAQVNGQVLNLGLGDGYYRPNCWVPMVAQLTSASEKAETYKLVVKQTDLDGDHVLYSRNVVLGGANTAGKTANFWMYFLPQPTLEKEQISTQKVGANDFNPLEKNVQVFVCDTGGRQLVQLHLTRSLNNLDGGRRGGGGKPRGNKLVLCIANRDTMLLADAAYSRAVGLSEDVTFSVVSVNNAENELPDNVLGYDAVDAVVWLDADPNRLPPRVFDTLKEYVRRGGKFVVCHGGGPEWAGVATRFADLLPVSVERIEQVDRLVALAEIHRQAIARQFPERRDPNFSDFGRFHGHEHDPDVWKQFESRAGGGAGSIFDSPAPEAGPARPASRPATPAGTQAAGTQPAGTQPAGTQPARPPARFDLARATLKPGAVADVWAPGPSPTPYLARGRFGLGSVTWVAQDLASGNFRAGGEAWPWQPIWDRVLDWPNPPLAAAHARATPDNSRLYPEGDEQAYGSNTHSNFIRLDATFFKSLEGARSGAALVGLAVLFFIGYWVVAGPGSYLFLRARRRAGYSWLAYALTALVALALTVGIVKLVLRGAPEVQHVSFVRVAPGEKAIVRSLLGLYIPRDGAQTLSLLQAPRGKDGKVPLPVGGAGGGEAGAGGGLYSITPLAIHPEMYDANNVFTSPLEYEVPVLARKVGEEKEDAQAAKDGVVKQVDVPYRSTLKKLQATWTGEVAGVEARGDEAPRLPADSQKDGFVAGTLVNRSGLMLRNVYVVFNRPDTVVEGDTVLYTSQWNAGEAVDLREVYKGAKYPTGISDEPSSEPRPLNTTAGTWTKGMLPRVDRPAFNQALSGWDYYWLNRDGIRNGGFNSGDKDVEDASVAFAMLSLFDHLPVTRASNIGNFNRRTFDGRSDLGRRGGRFLDVSADVAAGQLVVLAEADTTELPLPLEVNGASPKAKGTTYYQFILPLDRSAFDRPPATRPAKPEAEQ